MVSRAMVLCVTVGMVALVAAPAPAQPYSYLPLDHWAYNAFHRFVAWGLIPSHLVAAKPLMREEAARLVLLLRQAEGVAFLEAADRKLLEALSGEFAPEIAALQGSQAGGRAVSLRLAGRAGTGPTLTAHPSLRPGSDSAGRFAMGLGRFALDATLGVGSASVSRAAVSTALGPVRLQLGREAVWWGPGTRGALLVSDSAGALDMLKLTWDTSDIRFTKFIASLDAPGRYLVGTRVDWRTSPSVRIALSETAVAFPSQFLWYHLVNPAPAVLTDLLGVWDLQYSMGANDNFLVGVDFDARLRPGVLFYGEVMYDDIRSWQPLLEGILLFPRPPSRYGFLAGVYLTDPLRNGRTELRLEYSRVYNWTYNHSLADRRYESRGRPLGHWLGPDGDDLAIVATHRLSARENLEVWAALTRHGEGRIGREPADAEDAWRNRFLSGVVEARYSLGASWTKRNGPEALALIAELAFVRNWMNMAGDDRPAYFLGITYSRTW